MFRFLNIPLLTFFRRLLQTIKHYVRHEMVSRYRILAGSKWEPSFKHSGCIRYSELPFFAVGRTPSAVALFTRAGKRYLPKPSNTLPLAFTMTIVMDINILSFYLMLRFLQICMGVCNIIMISTNAKDSREHYFYPIPRKAPFHRSKSASCSRFGILYINSDWAIWKYTLKMPPYGTGLIPVL